METSQLPQGIAAHPLQGPHKEISPPDLPSGFMPLRLLLLPGGLCVDLTRPDMLVGRHSQADIRLALPDISRRHCRLVFQHGSWKVIDLNSLNGVFVNNERMHEAVLYDGDQLRLGSFTFAVQFPAQPPTVLLASLEKAEGREMIQSIANALPAPPVLPPSEQRKAC